MTSALVCCFAVKARAGILDCQMNLIRRSPQSHFEVSYPTMFGRIMQGFLQNPEQSERDVRLQRAGQIVALEVNLDFLLLGKLSTEPSHGHSNTQILQFCRVQLMRQGL